MELQNAMGEHYGVLCQARWPHIKGKRQHSHVYTGVKRAARRKLEQELGINPEVGLCVQQPCQVTQAKRAFTAGSPPGLLHFLDKSAL